MPIRRIACPGDPAAPVWPSYGGVSEYVGTSATGINVFVDPSLGPAGLQNAQYLLSDADRIVAFNNTTFGLPAGAVPVFVIVFALGGATDGTGGADHMGCDFTSGNAIEVCCAFGQPARVSALFEAELSECAMNGSLCGLSTGEALSRWCASAVSGDALSDFATAPTWAADGMPNFVDAVDPTDGNPDSTGCGMAFLSWLQSLGYSLPSIAQIMVSLGDVGTLAALYAIITMNPSSGAWSTFQAAIAALPGGIATDDPFAGIAPAPPGPVPPPVPPPAPGAQPALTLDQVVALVTDNWPPPAP